MGGLGGENQFAHKAAKGAKKPTPKDPPDRVYRGRTYSVKRDGEVVGPVAVSGLPQEEDMEVVLLGVAALG